MKLATFRQGGRDGTLVIVDRALETCAAVPSVAPTMQAALDEWDRVSPKLAMLYDLLNKGTIGDAVRFDPAMCAAPLPRAYQWVDGSAYMYHVELVRKARGAELPPNLLVDPLMYQGVSDCMSGPRDAIEVAEEAWGIDFESEVAVITDDVPMGIAPAAAAAHIKLVTILNDVSLRNLIPGELAKGFGFLQGKPASAFAPVFVTPDELGQAWDGRKLSLPLVTRLNGEIFGQPNAGEDMTFDFPTLIAHAARTRRLGAGTIVGSGTVSNRAPGRGSSCLAEKRTIETIETGKPATPFMSFGDKVSVEMLGPDGHSIFGAIEQTVVRYAPPA
ncbi:MAG: fumarylacetoacetate hydrolase family protein [Rhodospirillales bacterium]